MTNRDIDPFDECPILESKQLLLRLVEVDDSVDLLECYSDLKSVEIFNSDNCNSNFHYTKVDEVIELIEFWLREYKNRGYVRYSIVDKEISKVIGTIEIFAKKDVHKEFGKVGLLRLDLVSTHETSRILNDVMRIVESEFIEIFKIDSIITKVNCRAKTRVSVLLENDYIENTSDELTTYDDYYIKRV